MTVATTVGGDVEGLALAAGLRFAGIPYAAPPLGELRFAAPHPIEPWSGIRPAIDPGAISLQNEAPLEAALGARPLPQSEDCLSLTVWTPATDGANRPVMVWIHGGGFVNGSASSLVSDGARLSQHGDVVVVSINYRLGALGFLHLGALDPALSSSGLNGILDQIAALEWVRDNIAAFGGNPNNVTVFGGSAGAKSIGVLLSMPKAAGLFHRAILQSGAGQGTVSVEGASQLAARFCELTGSTTVSHLRALPPATILAAQATIGTNPWPSPADRARVPGWSRGFHPVVDGRLLPVAPTSGLRSGQAAPTQLLMGTTSEEWRLFAFMAPGPTTDADLARLFTEQLTDPVAAIATYRARLGAQASSADVHAAMLTDREFRVPMYRLADASTAAGIPTWLYRFAYGTPVGDGLLGSCHALDVPFVFDNRSGPIERFVGSDSPDSLAHAMQRSWVQFARSGDPNHAAIPSWQPQQSNRRPVIRFDATTTMTVDPEPDELAVWANLS